MVATLEKNLSETTLYQYNKGTDLFFYDADLEGRDNLISNISKDSIIIPINKWDNFFTKLADYSNVKIGNLFILAHGNAGEIKLGSENIDTDSLRKFEKSYTTLNVEKITLLSCNVGQDLDFIKAFSEVCNCDVNYSDNLVGHKSLGGSWDLNTYSINTASNNITSFSLNSLPFSSEVLDNWEYTLPVTIGAGDVTAFVANPTSFSGYASNSHVIVTGEISAAQATALDGVAATYIDATVELSALSALAGIPASTTNKFKFTTSDTSASASTLKSITDKTTAAVDFSSIDQITASSAADIKAIYADTTTTFATDVILNVNDSTVQAADLKAVNLLSTAKVIATTASTISGTVADLDTVFADTKAPTNPLEIALASDVAVTVTDTTVDAGDLLALDEATAGDPKDVGKYTTGRFTVSSSTLIGTKAEVERILGATYGVAANATNPARFTNIKDINITLDSGTRGTVTPLSAAHIGDVIDLTNAKVTATTNTVAMADLLASGALSGTGHTIKISDITDDVIAAANLKTLDAITTEKLTFNKSTLGGSPKLTGSASDIVALYQSSGIEQNTTKGIGASVVDANSGNTSVAHANIIRAGTTGRFDATIAETTMSGLAGLVADASTTDTRYAISVGDLELDAAALNALDGKTDSPIVITAANKITGDLTNLEKVYNTNRANFDGEGAELVTVTDTALDAALLNTINTKTTGVVTVSSSATSISGTDAAVKTALTNSGSGVAGLIKTGASISDLDVTIVHSAAGLADAENIDAIAGVDGSLVANGLTSGTVTLGAKVTGITGTKANVDEVLKLYQPATATPPTQVRVSGLDGLRVEISNSQTLDAIKTLITTYPNIGVVKSTVTTTTSALASYATLPAGNELSFTVDDDAIADVSVLNALAAKTTGTITLDPTTGAKTSPAVTGSAAELAKYFNNAKIAVASGAGKGTERTVISAGVASAKDLKDINAGHKGTGTGTNGEDLDASNVTSVTGLIADVKAVYTADFAGGDSEISGLGGEPINVTDMIVSAADLKAVTGTATDGSGAKTTGAINVISTGIKGDYADVEKMLDIYGTLRFSGLDSATVDIDDALDVTKANDLVAITTGTVTGTLTTAALSTFATVTADKANNNLNFNANDAQIDANALATLRAKTTGTIGLTAVNSLVGTADNVIAAFNGTYAASNGLDGAEDVVLTDAPDSAKLATVLGKTTGTVTATATDNMANLLAISETGNAITYSVTDSEVAATDVIALKAKTSATVTLANSVTITGNKTDIVSALGTAGVVNPGLANLSKTNAKLTGGSYKVVDINAVDTALDAHSTTFGTITATVTEKDTATLETLARAGAYTITIERTSEESAVGAGDNVEKVNAAKINDINALTTEVITVNTSDHVHGTTAAVKTALEADAALTTGNTKSVTGLGNAKITVDTTGIAISDANYISARTTGVVTASLATLEIESFIAPTTDVIAFESGNNYSFEIDDDTVLTKAEVKQLILLNNATSGTILIDPDDGTAPDMNGELADLLAIAQSGKTAAQIAAGDTNGFKGLEAAKYTITDTGAVSLESANAIEATTSGDVVLTTAASLTGSITEVDKAYAATSTITNTVDTKPVTVTGTITVTQANTAGGYTSGVLTATVSDTAANLVNIENQATNVITVAMTGTTAAATDIATVEARTAGLITSTVGTITGSAANLKTALALNDGTKITGLETAAVTISGGASVADANIIHAATNGVVSGSITTTDIATLKTLAETENAYTVTVADGALTAVDLKNLNSKTTGKVTATAVTNITGAISDLKSIYEAAATEIEGLGNETITITDSGSVLAADLHLVNTRTSGILTANSVTSVKGSTADLLKVYTNSAGVIAGLNNETLVITDTGTVAAADINTLDDATLGTITATGITKLTGTVTEITEAKAAATMTGVTSLALTGSNETFNATSYLASNADLIKAFGNSPDSAVNHYLAFGVNESRNLDSFDEKSYLASHGDLLTAFGSDTTKATNHYISNGYSENRALDTFDEFGYVASYSDLITALGADATAAVDHYINFGYGENRSSTFNASSYLSANADLQTAFGSDLEAAKKHYINHGASENRLLA
tara:strand:- start:489 stop:6767 length:6279 start_codon:yes stop_codon:yes gene_type:complete